MKAIILSIGDELITGQTLDTNGAHLARELGRLGIETIQHVTLGDDRRAGAEAITAAAGRADYVLVTGGLGPTADDITRQALADAMGVELALDAASLATIEEFFRRRGRTMVPANRAQAMVPTGAESLENQRGTAPGLRATLRRAEVFIMPGVPAEMRWMFEHVVGPRLPRRNGVIIYRVLHTFGLGESDIATKVDDLMRRGGAVSLGTTVAAGMVSMRVISRAETLDDAERQAAETFDELRRRLGTLVVGEGEATMASVTGELLRKAAQTLSTAESCTGGLLGEMVTDVSGASEYFLGGVVSYSNRVKRDLLAVPAAELEAHGAVSEPVAAAMAEGVRRVTGSDWSVSITGIAGPAGGSDEKPVGLVYIALAGPEGTEVHRHVLPGTRETIRHRAALAALNYVRMALLEG